MTIMPINTFTALENAFDAWIEPTGAQLLMGALAPDTSDSAEVHMLRIGWSAGAAQDRMPGDRQIVADFVVTASAPDTAQSDGILGGLLLGQPDTVDALRPVPPDSSVWRLLSEQPRPALLASCPMRLSPKATQTPPVEMVVTNLGPSRAIEGIVVDENGPVPAAHVGLAGGAEVAETDASGRFRIGGWCGQHIIASHRGRRRTVVPEMGSDPMTISLAKEA